MGRKFPFLGKDGKFLSLQSENVAENATPLKALFVGLCKEVHPEKQIEMEELKT